MKCMEPSRPGARPVNWRQTPYVSRVCAGCGSVTALGLRVGRACLRSVGVPADSGLRAQSGSCPGPCPAHRPARRTIARTPAPPLARHRPAHARGLASRHRACTPTRPHAPPPGRRGQPPGRFPGPRAARIRAGQPHGIAARAARLPCVCRSMTSGIGYGGTVDIGKISETTGAETDTEANGQPARQAGTGPDGQPTAEPTTARLRRRTQGPEIRPGWSSPAS